MIGQGRIVLKKGSDLLLNSISRPKGNINEFNSNIPSYHAEQQLLKKISLKHPEFLKNKGRGLNIEIHNNGKCSKPCKLCWNLLVKMIPYCKIIYVDENGTLTKSSLNNIDNITHSFGTRTRCGY